MPAAAVSPLRAFAIAAAGIAFFSVMDMVMKGLTLAIGAYSTLLYRSLVGILLAGIPYAFLRTGWPSKAALRLHIIRAVIMVPMSILFFWGLARVPMAQAVALTFIAPLLALFLAALLLKESIGPRTIGGSLLAFAGVVVIFVGQAQADLGDSALIGSAAILGSAAIYAFNIIVMRAQALEARPVEIAFFQNLIAASLFAAAALVMGLPPVPPAIHWVELVAAAVLALISMWLLAWAYAHAGAAYLLSTEYTAFLWAILLGWWRFGEEVSPFTLAGAALIVGGCLIAARTKTKEPAMEIAN